ncbi:MAG: 30S ribosomal protein S12 methylthiotransferase RimO [Nitrospinae bacterium]|nr:30S ribosomal protein S12 methylthiotransferase RimO [Nitrospinota bacterium]
MKRLRDMRLHMVSLGCAKNRVDSEKTLALLQSQGCTITDNPEEADCLLINTCGFIGDARRESVDTILELAEFKKANPNAKLAVMGCMVERFGKEMGEEMPEIDYLLALSDSSTQEVYRPENVKRMLEPGVVSAYLKIAEGCGNACSFCSIPMIRGPLKSRPLNAVVAEAKELVAVGVKELVLVAQDTTRYGADLKMKNGLVTLAKEILATAKPAWLRIMYLYPTLITDEMIDLIAHEPSLCPYIDVPFQHIHDAALKRMGRNETKKEIVELVAKLRRAMPEGAIRTSFIVGFPGETEAEYKALESFVKEAELDHVGVFTYSAEEGTKAADMDDDVPENVKEERAARILEIQQKISLKKNKAKAGKTFDALVERYDPENGLLLGRLKTQAPEVDGEVILDECEAKPGEIIKVKIKAAMEYDLVGVPA